jgi:DNA-binding HxlR family transcriptional regulator
MRKNQSMNRMNCDTRHRDICAVEMQDALRCLEGRWKMMILSHLFAGPVLRFSDLQRAIPGVSQKMLIQQLRDLEQHSIAFSSLFRHLPTSLLTRASRCAVRGVPE